MSDSDLWLGCPVSRQADPERETVGELGHRPVGVYLDIGAERIAVLTQPTTAYCPNPGAIHATGPGRDA